MLRFSEVKISIRWGYYQVRIKSMKVKKNFFVETFKYIFLKNILFFKNILFLNNILFIYLKIL